jgi:uncharacterized protein (TIGR03083 family)
MTDRMQLAADERRDLADFLDTLTAEQWSHATLCKAWTVRDVVAHVVSYEELGYLGLASAFVRGGFGPARINAQRQAVYRDRSPEQLVSLLRDHFTPHGLTAGFGGGIALGDCLIHQQDIRRPLGLPRDIPEDRVVEALEVTLKAPVLPTRRNAQGLRVTATDIGWSHGDGAEITGAGEALLMALAGRADALGELEGPGLVTLESRVVNASR